jgi:putative hydrolase of HD superfamily
MNPTDLSGSLQFLRSAEALKTTLRSAFTSTGEQESVAEHSWRLCLMAMVLAPCVPDVDVTRLLKICVVHDLGEALSGDIPAPEQVRRKALGEQGKADAERRDLETLLAPLPDPSRREILSLWDEYELASTPEARLAKALDKLETILQHTQGRNPIDFDYAFNLQYGREHTAAPPVVAELRAALDTETARRASRG